MIHHYTTIETLALILSNHKFRFSRLDKVDDIEESEFTSGPSKVRLGNYVFASCWTRFDEENISLWKMYSGYDGVRISLPENDIFKAYNNYSGNCKFYFDKEVVAVGKDSVLCNIANPILCEDVVYTDDPNLLTKDIITATDTHITLSSSSAGKYKRKNWEFQKECRFKVILYPMPEKVVADIEKMDLYSQLELSVKGIAYILQQQRPISQEYIDMPLSDTALDHLQVMLGPKTSFAQEILVKALLNQYAPKAVLKHSQLRLRK